METSPDGPLLGSHVSIRGGLANAIDRAEELGLRACQIFVKSASQWKGRQPSEHEVDLFKTRRAEGPIERVITHGTYLVNPAATSPANRERSLSTLIDELRRSARLGLDGLVIHPGAHLGAGESRGLERIARSIDRAHQRVDRGAPPILLENTAGQGTVLGYRLEQLAEIIDRTTDGDRLGVCIDTCHAFAAGYPIDTRDGFEDFLESFERLIGLERLGCLHLNDSKHALGSRKDRHANLGAGEIGLETFRWIVDEPRFNNIPMILETPLGDDGKGHERDLFSLRSLIV
jgi:deoxyribonuclease-4